MSKYTIRPLRLGTIRRKKSNMCYGDDTELMDFALIAWYLESADHKIIVDTGGSEPEGSRYAPYTRTQQEEPEQALASAGIDPLEIDTVILTHLHWDHCGSNAMFPNARFVCQRREYEYLLASDTDKRGYEVERVLATQYDTVEGDCELYEGISLILTPGHSIGSQCVSVDTEAGKYIIGGDLVPLFDNWEAIPHIPNGIHYDLDVIRASLTKLDRLGGIVLPGHDIRVFKRELYP